MLLSMVLYSLRVSKPHCETLPKFIWVTFCVLHVVACCQTVKCIIVNHCSNLFPFLQIELGTGKFPYTQWKTPFEQLKQVVHEPSPTLPDGGPHSDEFRDFIVQWLVLNA